MSWEGLTVDGQRTWGGRKMMIVRKEKWGYRLILGLEGGE